MAVVHFASAQRKFVGGAEQVEVQASRVVDLLRELEKRFPELAGKLDDSAVSIDGDIHNDARYQPLEADSEVHFLGQIAGGARGWRRRRSKP